MAEQTEAKPRRLTALCIVILALFIVFLGNSAAARPGDPWDQNADVKLPLSQLKTLAERGDREAEFFLGERYMKGLGIAQNNETALVWYRKAASKKYPPALTRLAGMYYDGVTVPEDERKALGLLEEAAALHEPDAEYQLGIGMEDRSKGLPLLMRAANDGSVKACLDLAGMYRDGKKSVGIKKNEKEAVRWFKRVYDLGECDEAGSYLATAYYYGRGVPKDDRAAVTCFAKGQTTPEALKWYERLSANRPISKSELDRAVQWMLSYSAQSKVDIRNDINRIYGPTPRFESKSILSK
jgi:TPR repeat protein